MTQIDKPAKKVADINMSITVEFEDNGLDELEDQAVDVLMEKFGLGPQDVDLEVLEVRDAEGPDHG